MPGGVQRCAGGSSKLEKKILGVFGSRRHVTTFFLKDSLPDGTKSSNRRAKGGIGRLVLLFFENGGVSRTRALGREVVSFRKSE